jgi:hypothetical protein
VAMEANASTDRSLDRSFGQSHDKRNDLNLGASGRVLRDKWDEERLSMRMRECRGSYPDCRATGRTRMIGVFVVSGGQDIPIQAAESHEAFTACWRFVRGEKLVQGKKW